MSRALRILVVDDHFVARFGLRGFLDDQSDMEVVAEAMSGDEAIARYAEHAPDVVLLDFLLPGKDGEQVTKELLARFPDAKVLILSQAEGGDIIRQVLESGARGFVSKDLEGEDLLAAIRAVGVGQRYLSPRAARLLAEAQREVPISERERAMLELILKGSSNKEIAAVMGLSEGTVRVYTSHLFKKLDVSNRTEAVSLAVQRGLIRGA